MASILLTALPTRQDAIQQWPASSDGPVHASAQHTAAASVIKAPASIFLTALSTGQDSSHTGRRPLRPAHTSGQHPLALSTGQDSSNTGQRPLTALSTPPASVTMGRHARGSSVDELLLAYAPAARRRAADAERLADALPALSNHVAAAYYCPASVAAPPRLVRSVPAPVAPGRWPCAAPVVGPADAPAAHCPAARYTAANYPKRPRSRLGKALVAVRSLLRPRRPAASRPTPQLRPAPGDAAAPPFRRRPGPGPSPLSRPPLLADDAGPECGAPNLHDKDTAVRRRYEAATLYKRHMGPGWQHPFLGPTLDRQ